MKVLYCITRSDTIGGAHVHVADMAEWMIQRGHEASVLFGGIGPYSDVLERKRVPYQSSSVLERAISPVNDLRAIGDLASRFSATAPDLISLHSAKAGFIGRLAARKAGTPVVFTAHGWSFTDGVSSRSASVYKRLERWSSPLANRIIAVSEYDRRLALVSGVCKPDHITAIHNGMPDRSERAEPGRRNRPVVITMVARLDAQKDHETLLAALARIGNRNWRLNLIGDGPLESVVKERVRQLGLCEQVTFLGLRHDVHEILVSSDLFALVSNWEGFPRSILEAMRVGLPVVASDVGGVSEAVEEGHTGFLVPRGDVAALAACFSRLLASAECRVALGSAGRARFESQFLFERMAQATFDVYESVLAKAGARS